jgi:undecaprenyl-diphosphatase
LRNIRAPGSNTHSKKIIPAARNDCCKTAGPIMDVPRIPLPKAFDRWDAAFDRFWEPLRRNAVLNKVFYTASEVGDFGMVWLAIGALQGAIGPDAKTKVALRLAVALGVESVLVNGVIKSFFRRERPNWEQNRPLHLRKPRTSSFPSGHASSAVTAAILLSSPFGAWTIAYAALAAIVALSRVHVKIHHVSDVAGGLLVGALFGTLVKLLWVLP